MDCAASFDPDNAYKYGQQWKCKPCHSSQRWLRENDPDWNNKTPQQKKELIVANRDHGGRGSARQMQKVHKVHWHLFWLDMVLTSFAAAVEYF